MEKLLKNKRGISLISLVVAISIMIIITSLLIFNAKNGIKIRTLTMMRNDISLLDDKVNSYYVKYGALPIEIKYNIASLSESDDFKRMKNPNDSEEGYYVLDLKAFEGLTLNYGADFNYITQENVNDYNDLYIINEQSFQIYYVRGIELDGVIYHTNDISEEIEMIEYELEKDVTATLKREPEAEPGIWKKEVNLTGIGEVKEGKNLEIKRYAFTKDKVEPEESDWKEAEESEKTRIEKSQKETENGVYIFWVQDEEGNIYKSNKVNIQDIDNNPPTVGSIIATKLEYNSNKTR